jgi:hypothetical protein
MRPHNRESARLIRGLEEAQVEETDVVVVRGDNNVDVDDEEDHNNKVREDEQRKK